MFAINILMTEENGAEITDLFNCIKAIYSRIKLTIEQPQHNILSFLNAWLAVAREVPALSTGRKMHKKTFTADLSSAHPWCAGGQYGTNAQVMFIRMWRMNSVAEIILEVSRYEGTYEMATTYANVA